MVKIMFVCHGNICRSPMAEFVCKDLLQKQGRQAEFTVASSAVSREEIRGDVGHPVYPPVASLLRRKGIGCEGKRAVQLTRLDGPRYDYFVCMDENNLRGALRILGEAQQKKCVKLLSFCDSDEDVSDPWYTRDFETCYNDVLRGVQAMLRRLS